MKGSWALAKGRPEGKESKMITGFRRFRVSVKIAAVALVILAMPLVGVVLAKTNQEEVASPSHAQRAFEQGSGP